MEKSNANNGSLIYYIDDSFFKMRVSVRFTNMNGFMRKGFSSNGNPFCSIGKDVRKTLHIDLNPLIGKDFSLDSTVFLNKFEQSLFIKHLDKFYEKLLKYSDEIYRKNDVDGIECYEVIESGVIRNSVFDNINFASGKNIELVPVADRTKDDRPFCGVMMAINHRAKYIIMTPDEFEYFIEMIKGIDIDKYYYEAISLMYLADLNNSGKIINNMNKPKVINKPNEVQPVSDYVNRKPVANKINL